MIRGLLLLAVVGQAYAAFPDRNETLRYDVKLPNGSVIGSATLEAARVKGTASTWQFTARTDFSFLSVPIVDSFRSLAANFCSAEFEKDSRHGPKKTGELVVFHPRSNKAVRTTKGGGVSELPAGPCPRDPVNVLYFTRVELGRGAKPFNGSTIFGAAYEVKMESRGKSKVKIGAEERQADRVTGSYKGPKSSGEFEIFFARDDARTPLVFRIPLPVGSITLELKP